MKLTKEQFRAQFKYPVDFADCSIQPMPIDSIHGYKMFRALQMIVLQEKGKFFVSRLA